MSVCVCVRVGVVRARCARTHARTQARTRTRTHTRTRARLQACPPARLRACLRACLHLCARTGARGCVRSLVHVRLRLRVCQRDTCNNPPRPPTSGSVPLFCTRDHPNLQWNSMRKNLWHPFGWQLPRNRNLLLKGKKKRNAPLEVLGNRPQAGGGVRLDHATGHPQLICAFTEFPMLPPKTSQPKDADLKVAPRFAL